MERRFAAIFTADMVCWSRLVGVDEVATLTTLKAYRQIIRVRRALYLHRR